MMSKHVYSSLIALLVGCMPMRPPGPTPDGDGGCAAACRNLATLKCDGWMGSPGEDGVYRTVDDVPCQEVCEEIEDLPGGSMNTGCAAAVSSCDLLDRCMAEGE